MEESLSVKRDLPRLTVTAKAARSASGGHPWIYGTEVVSDEGGWSGGDVVDVFSEKGKYLGSGFVNGASKIRVRLISCNANDRFDDDFFRRRVSHALDYRRTVMGGAFDCCRLVFGEADRFPGMTVDRFGDVLSVQTLCLGVDMRKDLILGLILDDLRSSGDVINTVYLRNDSPVRALEGLAAETGFYKADGLCETDGRTVVIENGLRFAVDYAAGQKTGFFLDQKFNRAAVGGLCRGKKVLDCFTHTGGFALNCVKGGAERVTAVDVSESACGVARENAAMNGMDDRVDVVCADVFDYLETVRRGEYDLIILDPPAFTKSRDTVKSAARGYGEINERAMRLLGRGGYLATCSCSHFMTAPLFRQMLHGAAERAGVGLRQVEERRQSPDHPILWNVPETEYLKFFIFQIV
ncbi:MAG: class I SAM-dependent rRNA methyltransferase [Clostridia bacterium]|nr:class I SAM-dependent rRNA methyltransferase [Clostridia bacterium]